MLTGQASYWPARVTKDGQVRHVPRDRFRRFMAEDAELSDIILEAFIARRQILLTGDGARSIELIGSAQSAEGLALRNWAARQILPHTWIEVGSPEADELMAALDVGTRDLPVAVTPNEVIRNATPGKLSENLGLSYRAVGERHFDLVVVGGGPAGLAAAVYGASEGLDTVLFDATQSAVKPPLARASRTTWAFLPACPAPNCRREPSSRRRSSVRSSRARAWLSPCRWTAGSWSRCPTARRCRRTP